MHVQEQKLILTTGLEIIKKQNSWGVQRETVRWTVEGQAREGMLQSYL